MHVFFYYYFASFPGQLMRGKCQMRHHPILKLFYNFILSYTPCTCQSSSSKLLDLHIMREEGLNTHSVPSCDKRSHHSSIFISIDDLQERRVVELCSVEASVAFTMKRVKFASSSSGVRNNGKVMVYCSVRMKMWIMRGIAILLLWTCIAQLSAIGEVWGSKLLLLKTWPSRNHFRSMSNDNNNVSHDHLLQPIPTSFLPSMREVHNNNGYLVVSCNGGLNQMRAAICDMVAIAQYLNVTLIVPELDKTSFWSDPSNFEDIFDANHFIDSLRDEVHILRELPPRLKRRVQLGMFYELSPVSWSNLSYYHDQILPQIKRYEVVRFNRTDSRLANNGLPLGIQKLRCKVNFSALRFSSHIEESAQKVIKILRQNGPYMALHLRYEMDMLAFSGCTHGCSDEEADELTRMRYSTKRWKEKIINSELKRRKGLCPLTPEETALTLQALGIDPSFQIYLASGEIYGGPRRLQNLYAAFPHMVRKETLLEPLGLRLFKGHQSQLAALDYLVSLESDIFVPTYAGNMARVVEGHRRYLGFRKTILLDRKVIVRLTDRYKADNITWGQYSLVMKKTHRNRTGKPKPRSMIPGKPKKEDNFYANPQECLKNQGSAS
ncbi:unnamed protein product [Cuscuta europaea]|uniref:O-fucosyltransferase family protein n=1 Tax=Cuscuta europaea TaxID=41803 RepID=A0A9P1EA39_CUSEU|nr:unnamed protein product [Cuscuta europaea]